MAELHAPCSTLTPGWQVTLAPDKGKSCKNVAPPHFKNLKVVKMLRRLILATFHRPIAVADGQEVPTEFSPSKTNIARKLEKRRQLELFQRKM